MGVAIGSYSERSPDAITHRLRVGVESVNLHDIPLVSVKGLC